MTKTSDILILGATGLTGRQVTKFLAAHVDRTSRNFTLAIAARSKQKLQALVSDLSLSQDINLVSLDVTNEVAVNGAMQQTRIVINTVGPYSKYGEPVVKACAQNGVHYVDLTGETLWIAHIIRNYDYLATKTHSIIVPSCGFDSIPSDLSVYIANKALKEVDPSLDIASSTTVFDKIEGIISAGTLDSAMAMRTLPAHERNASLRDYLLSPVQGPPSPQAHLLYNIQVPGTSRYIKGSFWFMSGSNRSIVQRSWGLLEQELLQKNTSTTTHRYGPSMVYEEFLKARGAISASIISTTIALVWGLLGFSPFRWLIRKLLASNVSTASDERLEKGSFRTINITTSTTSVNHPNPVKVTTTLIGKGDPGYLLSPIWMAECALALLDPESLPERARRGGILTPATAFGDVLVKRIEDNGRFIVKREVHDESKKTV
ncbi:hypothetical protein E1B28_010335 [Marasmius oreades]|uniref:Saccharopine dehydrogenase NADP binding domain-containing protein n=1 Tax=Marasmius oreades TaxID=181124 RepID=A0A9P7RX40_9AGAR|nr:uncharacterized protein E1B28_010335 [Marasmius oreades]KAG7091287.1 hypothetical protein E1B28_010335 [Marasmius oreades]